MSASHTLDGLRLWACVTHLYAVGKIHNDSVDLELGQVCALEARKQLLDFIGASRAQVAALRGLVRELHLLGSNITSEAISWLTTSTLAAISCQHELLGCIKRSYQVRYQLQRRRLPKRVERRRK